MTYYQRQIRVPVLRALASVYAGAVGFRQEWA